MGCCSMGAMEGVFKHGAKSPCRLPRPSSPSLHFKCAHACFACCIGSPQEGCRV